MLRQRFAARPEPRPSGERCGDLSSSLNLGVCGLQPRLAPCGSRTLSRMMEWMQFTARILMGVALLHLLCGGAVAVARQREAPAPAASKRAEAAPDDARIKAAGIRKLSGEHLTLYTDLPSTRAVDELPALFDQAYSQWQ